MLASSWLFKLLIPFARTAGALGLEKARRWLAVREAAISGGQSDQLSLETLVRRELSRLAASDHMPPEYRNSQFREWLVRVGQQELFAELLVIRSSGGHDAARAEELELLLSRSLSEHTGERLELASGPTRYVVDHLAAVCRGTPAFQEAMRTRTAGQVQALLANASSPDTSHSLEARVRKMAMSLLEAAKQNWSMPQEVATVSMVGYRGQARDGGTPEDIESISAMVQSGRQLILFGDGGLGKTTVMLRLCSGLLEHGGRIPLYLDAASWARSEQGVFQYITSRHQATAVRLNVDGLTRLAEQGRLTLLVNGWNEIEVGSRFRCLSEINDLLSAMPKVGFVINSRARNDFSGVDDAGYVEVRGLTWIGQVAIIKRRLPTHVAEEVINLLATRTRMRDSARSPLILDGVIARAESNTLEETSSFDFLGAAVERFERALPRTNSLQGAPIEGHQTTYLSALACSLTRSVKTVCDRDDALRALHSATHQLQVQMVVGPPPSPSSVLNALISHHLIQMDDGGVRFAHQLFQEYFAAVKVFEDCASHNKARSTLNEAMSAPGWAEALKLVAHKVRYMRDAKAVLVRAALQVDVGLACDLAGEAGFNSRSEPETYERCVRKLNELGLSSLAEVQQLATCLQMASRWPHFGERLWPLIEHPDRQVRLRTYRLESGGLSLLQLGDGAPARVAAWPSERRVEFVHEIASNPNNVDYLSELAFLEPDNGVRRAAIAALLWEYPASEVGFKAWAQAPVPVALSILGELAGAMSGAPAPAFVQTKLVDLSETLDGEGQLELAQQFPHLVSQRAVGPILESLRSSPAWDRGDSKLVVLARRLAPERLTELALDMAASEPRVPGWVLDTIKKATRGQQDSLVQSLLQAPNQCEPQGGFDPRVLCVLATLHSTKELVELWLGCVGEANGAEHHATARRRLHLRDALVCTDGGLLLRAVIQRADISTPREAVELAGLLMARLDERPETAGDAGFWSPHVDEVRQLLSVFSHLLAQEPSLQDSLRAHLCLFAAKSCRAKFKDFVVSSVWAHLRMWDDYRENLRRWSEAGLGLGEQRPTNPYMGQFFIRALTECGFDVIPDVLAMEHHPSSSQVVPQALAGIVAAPWRSKAEERSFRSPPISAEVAEGKKRLDAGLAIRQPATELGPLTEDVAQYFVRQLDAARTRIANAKPVESDERSFNQYDFQLGTLASSAANVPSEMVVEPLKRIMALGLVGEYTTADIVRGLLRMGAEIAEPGPVKHIEQLIADMSGRLQHSDGYVAGVLSATLVCTVPDQLLAKPWTDYLETWVRFSSWHDVVAACGTQACLRSTQILDRALDSGDAAGQAAEMMIRNVDSTSVHRLADRVRSGSLLRTFSGWRLQGLVPRLAQVLHGQPGLQQEFVDACMASHDRTGDALALHVLALLDTTGSAQSAYVLEALDSGRLSNESVSGVLDAVFWRRRDLGDGSVEVTPTACNALRRGLYVRARDSRPRAQLAKALLAKLESERRESGRPDDELRHPMPEDELEWMTVLV